eukprot:jgi/Ulvmu1/11625/UM008_0029.1
MAHVTYDIMWREAIMDLLDQLEAETPEDQALAPREFSEWACIYIKYLQIFRKLEVAYDQMVHPQKLVDMKRALEACMGRMLEVRHWLVKLNKGSDFLHIDDILVDLKLTPDELEVPVPRYFRLDNQKALDTRDIFLEQLIKNFNPKRIEKPARLESGAALPVDEALAVLQRNERGRQARQVARVKLINKKQRQLADRRNRTGVALTHEMAVTKIQSALRGMLWRRRIRAQADAELAFIGMKPAAAAAGERDPQGLEARNAARRKLLQAEHRRELERDVETLKGKVQETEGLDMRETVQDKINAWFVENRHPETGEYPDFPDLDEGGSKVILNPPPPLPEPDPALEAAAAKGGKAPAGDKGKGAKGKGGKGDSKDDAEAVPEEEIPSVFVPAIERAVQEFVAKWQDRDESMNFAQRYDPDLVKDELRPLVFEEIRLQVDEEMRVLLENLKDMVDAEKAAKSGKKVKKKKKKKKKKKGGKKGKKGKKKKDLTADRALEHLYVEMVSNGILQQPLKVKLSDYLGSAHLNAAALERSGAPPEASMAHVRQALTEFAVLPLGCAAVHERLEPHLKAVLLYGQHDSGKKLLAHAVANTTGANFFNLSPRNTDGKYQKKAVAMMLHIVFKVAKTMAPSVIFIDEVEKVFLSDKKKLKEFSSVEPYNRIKKELVKEMKQLKPGERVLVIGASSEPQLCAKKDEKALLGFFQKHICLPVPDYASRKLLLPGLVARHGAQVDPDFDWPTLAQITEGYTSGQLDQVVASILTERRLARLAVPSSANKLQMSEFINWLAKLAPVSQEAEDSLRKFTEATPARVARRVAAGDTGGGEGKRGAKKGGKKKK